MVKNFLDFVTSTGKICSFLKNVNMNFLLSLIKMMYWISEKSGETLTMNQLQHCLMRNFGGKIDVNKTVELFLRKVRADLLHAKSSTSDIEVSYYSCVPDYL